jgi:putative redox protein
MRAKIPAMANAQAEKPPIALELIWEHDLVFGGRTGDVRLTLDSDTAAGPSPMQALAFGLAGCMAMDVVHILRKSRIPLQGLKTELTGQRAPEVPHRFTAIALHFTVTGDVPAEQVQRAIELSREKYCSVWHSLRPDIELTTTFRVTSAV